MEDPKLKKSMNITEDIEFEKSLDNYIKEVKSFLDGGVFADEDTANLKFMMESIRSNQNKSFSERFNRLYKRAKGEAIIAIKNRDTLLVSQSVFNKISKDFTKLNPMQRSHSRKANNVSSLIRRKDITDSVKFEVDIISSKVNQALNEAGVNEIYKDTKKVINNALTVNKSVSVKSGAATVGMIALSGLQHAAHILPIPLPYGSKLIELMLGQVKSFLGDVVATEEHIKLSNEFDKALKKGTAMSGDNREMVKKFFKDGIVSSMFADFDKLNSSINDLRSWVNGEFIPSTCREAFNVVRSVSFVQGLHKRIVTDLYKIIGLTVAIMQQLKMSNHFVINSELLSLSELTQVVAVHDDHDRCEDCPYSSRSYFRRMSNPNTDKKKCCLTNMVGEREPFHIDLPTKFSPEADDFLD